MKLTKKQILQNWIEEYEDVYGKYPSEELIRRWDYEITETFLNDEEE